MSNAIDRNQKDLMLEVKSIIKEFGYDLSKLKQFQKKHPEIDISNYIHKAKMNTVKSAKKKKNKLIENSENNKFIIEAEELIGTNCEIPSNEDNINVIEKHELTSKYTKSYLWACVFNNDEFIKAHLISSKNDEDIKSKANEKDEYRRKGLFYLIYYGNYDMIKLSLLSGCLLADCLDIFDRNLFHYIAMTNSKYSALIPVIVKCFKLEFKRNFNELYSYIPKAFLTLKENSEQLSEENVTEILEEMNLNIEIKQEISEHDDIIRIYKSVISALNQKDLEGKTPLHYACEKNNLDVIKLLLSFHADPFIKDNRDNRPIDLANNDLIVQYILNHSRNNEIKSLVNKNDSMSLDQSSLTTKHNNLADLLDIRNLKLLSEEKISSFRSGYESNNYLILSVTSDNLESFKFLLKEKNMSLLIKNSNGWNAFHFIVKLKRTKFLTFLFGFNEEESKDLYEQCNKKTYSPYDLCKEKGGLNYIGESFVSLDQSTNNNINPICIAIDINQTVLFKVLLSLLKKRENLRELNSILAKSCISANLEFVINRKYDKYCQTLLHKAVEKKNLDMVSFLFSEYKHIISLSETDKDLQNVLHYAVNIAKQNNFITFFVKLDFDRCLLRTFKDKQGKIPQDYDTSNHFELFFSSIWDAAKSNNLTLAEKLLNSGFYTVDEQSNLFNNTPAHIAAINSADKVLLLLVKNNANLEIKNHKGLSTKDYCEKNGNKLFRKKANAILSGEIKEYSDLENYNKQNTTILNTTMINLNDKKVRKIIEDINAKAKEKNINFRKIFKTMDEDKNGRLDGHEFELLFTVMDLDVKKDDILLVMSYADKDRNGIIDLEEFLSLFPDHK